MAASDLSYVISVQMTQLEELKSLHDTIAAIQSISQQGAEFQLKVSSTSLSNLTKDIDAAVGAGLARLSGDLSGGGSSGRSTGTSTATTAPARSGTSGAAASMQEAADSPAPTTRRRTNKVAADKLDSFLIEFDTFVSQARQKVVRFREQPTPRPSQLDAFEPPAVQPDFIAKELAVKDKRIQALYKKVVRKYQELERALDSADAPLVQQRGAEFGAIRDELVSYVRAKADSYRPTTPPARSTVVASPSSEPVRTSQGPKNTSYSTTTTVPQIAIDASVLTRTFETAVSRMVAGFAREFKAVVANVPSAPPPPPPPASSTPPAPAATAAAIQFEKAIQEIDALKRATSISKTKLATRTSKIQARLGQDYRDRLDEARELPDAEQRTEIVSELTSLDFMQRYAKEQLLKASPLTAKSAPTMASGIQGAEALTGLLEASMRQVALTFRDELQAALISFRASIQATTKREGGFPDVKPAQQEFTKKVLRPSGTSRSAAEYANQEDASKYQAETNRQTAIKLREQMAKAEADKQRLEANYEEELRQRVGKSLRRQGVGSNDSDALVKNRKREAQKYNDILTRADSFEEMLRRQASEGKLKENVSQLTDEERNRGKDTLESYLPLIAESRKFATEQLAKLGSKPKPKRTASTAQMDRAITEADASIKKEIAELDRRVDELGKAAVVAETDRELNSDRARMAAAGRQVLSNNEKYAEPMLSSKQFMGMIATFDADPGSHSSRAFRHAAKAVNEGASQWDMQAFIQARDAGVLAIPDPLPGMRNPRAQSNAVSALREDRAKQEALIAGIVEKLKGSDADLADYSTEGAVKSPQIRAVLQEQLKQARGAVVDIGFEIDDIERRGANRVVDEGVAAYRTRLKDQFGRGEISPDQYRNTVNSLNQSDIRRTTLFSEDPNLEARVTLIPQALSKYIRSTFDRYLTELKKLETSGEKIDPSLIAEIKSNPLLTQLFGNKLPATETAAKKEFKRLAPVFEEYKKVDTAFEMTRGRRNPPVPLINPNPEITTAPFGEEGFAGPEDPAINAAILSRFQRSGGVFAPQTEERRIWVEQELRKLERLASRTVPPSSLAEAVLPIWAREGKPGDIRKRMQDPQLRPELLADITASMESYGGASQLQISKYAEDPSLVGMTLQQIAKKQSISPQEAALNLLSKGSASVSPMWSTEGLTEPQKARQQRLLQEQEFYAFGYYPGSSGANERGLVNGTWMSPAEARRVRRGGVQSPVVESPYGAFGAGGAPPAPPGSPPAPPGPPEGPDGPFRGANVQSAQQFAVAMKEVESALARVVSTLNDLTKLSFDPVVQEFKRLADTMAPYAESLDKVRKALVETGGVGNSALKVATARERQRAVEEERTKGYKERGKESPAERQAKEFGLPQLVGLPEMPSAVAPISQDPASLRALVLRGATQLVNEQRKLQDLMALANSQAASGGPVDRTRGQIDSSATNFDALVGTYATNIRTLAQVDPSFFGTSGNRASADSERLLGALNQRTMLGQAMGALQEAETKVAAIDVQLAELKKGPKTQENRKRTDDLTGARKQLTEFSEQQYRLLGEKGIIDPAGLKTMDTLITKFGQLNKLVGEYSQGLIETTNSSVKAAREGGSFADRVISKFQSLAAYVTAGGVVFQIANQLRMGVSESIGLEADLANIRGVLDTRSGMEARSIGTGLVQAALDYGVPLRQSLQAGKLFAQTGVGADKTVELTRASLAAQVGAGMEANQATELLVAVQNVTNDRVKAFDILDRISKVEAQYAVTAQDLANAIKRAGSLAVQLQPTALGATDALDFVIGATTTVVERTRITGEQAATALRFIISRLAAPEVSRALQGNFGIKLAGETPNTLRPLQDIFQEISERYKGLLSSGNSVQAQQLLATFAGARQANVAAALLVGFEDSLKTANASAYAFGDTQERVALQLDTVQAKLAQFNTSFTAFASSIFSETGLSGAIKLILDGANKALRDARPGPVGLGVAAGALALGYGAQAAVSPLTSLATIATGRNTAAGLMAGRGLAGAATAAGWAAGSLGPISIVLAVMSGLELLAGWFRRNKLREDLRTGESFDREFFRETPFYQGYAQRALNYGYTSPDDFATMSADISARVSRQVDQEISQGTIVESQRFKRTTGLLVDEFERVLPGFANLGTEAAKVTEALQILRQSAQFGLAIPQTAIDGLTTDLADFSTTINSYGSSLAKRLQEAGAETSERVYSGPMMGGYSTTSDRSTAQIISSISRTLDGLFKYQGKQFMSISDMNFPGVGGGSLNNIIERGIGMGQSPLAALDDYARNNLLLNDTDVIKLKAAETSLLSKRTDATDRYVSAQDRLTEALRMQGKVTEEQTLAMRTANNRLENQRKLANSVADRLEEAVGVDSRYRVLRGDLGAIGDEEGAVFAASIRQVINESLKIVQDRFQEGAYSTSEYNQLVKDLNKLNATTSRPAQLAELAAQMNAMAAARDRLFQPFIGYVSRSVDIRTQEQLTQRYGVSSDSVRARADAGQQLITQLGQVPVQLQQDMVRQMARFVGGAGRPEMSQAALNLIEDDLAGGSEGISNVFGGILDQSQASAQQTQVLAQIKAMQMQYKVIMDQGLGSFIEQGRNSASESVRSVANDLGVALNELVSLGDITDREGFKRLLQLLGDFDKLIAAANDVVGQDIRAAVERDSQLAAIPRAGENFRTSMQLSASVRQAQRQVELGRLQADPRQVRAALDLQLSGFQDQERNRIAVAQRTFEDSLKSLALQFPNDNDQRRKDQEAAARDAFGREEASARIERQLAEFSLVAQQDDQLTRRQQESAVQLVQDLTNPLRDFLMSADNFSREGVQRMVSGIAQAAQSRLVDIFMRRVFSESGILGERLAQAFNSGALSTETAIESGFRKGVAELRLALEQGVAGLAAQIPVNGPPQPIVPTAPSAVPGSTFSLTPAQIDEFANREAPVLAGLAGLGVLNVSTPVDGTLGQQNGSTLGKLDRVRGAVSPYMQRGFSFTNTRAGQTGGAILDAGLPLAGALVGSKLADQEKTYSAEGAAIFSMLGTAVNPALGAVGGIIGGLIGGMFNKSSPKEEKQIAALERIARNTQQQIEAIENQTQMLSLDSRFMNVPAGFVVPSFRPFGSGSTMNNSFEINIDASGGQNPEEIANLVAAAVQNQLRGAGVSFDLRRS
jgi:TP901 family phage tail tape measure protein